MIELELDGKTVNAEPGSTILEVAIKEGKYIPHFCYHKKLSIAANCRMCLVEVEKSNKPLPACATPISEGMKVHTCSKLAVEAQKGVMEFLLINHPLDCPVCDQGGECQLQDLAVGYGRSSTRFTEEKRAVTNKDLGPLVATAMTRCIHCSRCVRYTDEIAGMQELGMSYRNNHVEVMPFIGKTVNSEISGNIIDICPVGALLSKPFKNTTRNWELSRRKSIAAHDGLGSNIIAQTDKYHKVVRVLPLENEEINECWISDRDRFSYEGLYSSERITEPMIKQDGKWVNVDWETALNYAAKSINGVKTDHGPEQIGVLAGAASTTEELYLLQKLMRNFGVNNLDHRLTQTDFKLDGKQLGANFLGSSLNEFLTSKSVLVIGSVLREEQPLLAYKIRQAVKKGLELNLINVMNEDVLCAVKNHIVVDPRELASVLAQAVKATQTEDSVSIDLSDIVVSEKARLIAESLKQNNGYIVLGEMAKSSPNYSELVILAEQLAKNIQGKFGVLAGRANEVGATLVGCIPYKDSFNQHAATVGMNARQMLENQRKAYVLFNTELEHDSYDSKLALKALNAADTVIVMNAFINSDILQYADVVLPITPFTETAGSFVNMEGKWQKFNGVTRPLGNARPGWKVLRVLANQLNLVQFGYNTIDDVRVEMAGLLNPEAILNNKLDSNLKVKVEQAKLDGLIRLGIQGIYSLDSIIRRAHSLQQTPLAQLPTLSLNQSLADKLGVKSDATVTIEQDGKSGRFNVSICNTIPETAVLLAVNQSTCGFAGRFASISISV